MKQFDDLTQGEKSKLTRETRKLWKEYDSMVNPISDEAHSFYETLYPARNKKIDDAKQRMEEKIQQARDEYNNIREQVMSEFENHAEVKRYSKLLNDVSDIAMKKLRGSQNELLRSLGLQEDER